MNQVLSCSSLEEVQTLKVLNLNNFVTFLVKINGLEFDFSFNPGQRGDEFELYCVLDEPEKDYPTLTILLERQTDSYEKLAVYKVSIVSLD